MAKKPGATSYNFGKRGWIIVIISAFYWLLGSSLLSDGMNTLITVLTEQYGWTRTQMTFFGTLGGWVSILGLIVYGNICKKIGAKKVIIISLIGALCASILLGYTKNLAMYGIAVIAYYVLVSGANGIGVQNLGAEWFPKKKGMFMGISTMGITLGACTINLYLSNMLPRFGLSGAMWGYAALILVVIIFTVIYVKDTPEECGCFPDNDKTISREELAVINAQVNEYRTTSEWTVKKVLAHKNTWLISFGWGIVMMCAGGMLAQTVPALITYGHSPMFGIWLFTYLFPVGFFCSWLGGLIDDKYGTKAGSYFTAALLAAGALVILLFGTNKFAAGLGVALFMGAMSAGNNMTMSITTSHWGRYDFPNAWRVISITTKIITSCGIVLMSVIADATGSYKMSFLAMLASAVVAAIIMRFTSQDCVGRKDEDFIKAKMPKAE